jgi:hypothetical protein
MGLREYCVMSRESELKVEYDKGARDYDKGEHHLPSDNGLSSAIKTATGDSNSTDRDSAYNAGHSDAGRSKT